MVSIITHAAITQGPDLDPLLEPSNSCSFMNPDSRTFGYVHLEHGRHTLISPQSHPIRFHPFFGICPVILTIEG